MNEKPSCIFWSSNCHLLDVEEAKHCLNSKGNKYKCIVSEGWKHYPDSPFGNVYICGHGCIKTPEEKNKNIKICMFCDE